MSFFRKEKKDIHAERMHSDLRTLHLQVEKFKSKNIELTRQVQTLQEQKEKLTSSLDEQIQYLHMERNHKINLRDRISKTKKLITDNINRYGFSDKQKAFVTSIFNTLQSDNTQERGVGEWVMWLTPENEYISGKILKTYETTFGGKVKAKAYQIELLKPRKGRRITTVKASNCKPSPVKGEAMKR